MKNLILISSVILFSLSVHAQNLPTSILNELRDQARLRFNSQYSVVETLRNMETIKLGNDISVQTEVVILDAKADVRQTQLCSFLYVSEAQEAPLVSIDCNEL